MAATVVGEGVDARSWTSADQVVLSTASLAAAGIHFAVMPDHFQEYVPFGVFFSVVAWLQALWAVGLVLRPGRWLLAAGVIGNLGVVAIWTISRTAGLPLGPEPGVAEAVSFVDVFATVLEGLIAAGCAVLLVRPGAAASFRGPASRVALAVFVLVLAFLTSAAIASSSDHGGGAGHGSERHEQASGVHAEPSGLDHP
jgi:hypothetical protein